MAFRSNIYEENQLNAYRKAQEAQRQAEEEQRQAYERALQAQNAAAQAQNKQTNPLESVLSGIANSLKNVGDTLYNMGGTGVAAFRDMFTGNAGTGKYQNEWKDYLKKTQYGDENMSDKDYYLKTGGKGIDAAATVSDLIPGLGKGAKVALNVGQGIASGAVNPIIEYGSQANLEDILKGAAVGGAGAGVGQYVGNKLGSMAPATSRLGKIATSNIGRGALTGAASGAVAGGLNAGLNGGNVFEGAIQGAERGGIGGGTMAGVMGVTGKALQKLNNKVMTPTITPDATDNVVNKTTQDVASAPMRRNIPITDYDNGEVPIRVRGANQGNRYSLGKGQGSLIDGVLAPDNAIQLPNAQKPNPTIGEYMLGDKTVTNAYDAIPRLIDETWGDTFNKNAYDDMMGDLDAPTRAKLTAAIQDMASLNNMTDGETNLTSKSQLPKIKTSDYTEATGYKGKDIPDYMRPYLAKDGLSLKDGAWAQYMPKYSDGGTFTGTPDDILGVYDRLAGTNQNNIYTADNVGMALKMDPELNQAVTDQMLKAGYNTRNIPVKGAPSITDNIDVQDNNLAPIRTTKRVLNPNPATPATPQAMATPEDAVNVNQSNVFGRALKNAGNDLQAAQTNITRAERRKFGIKDAGETVNQLRKRTGLSNIDDQADFAKNITGSDGSVMDDVLRYNISKDENGQPLTLRQDQYVKAINDAVGKEWKKSVMGETYEQFRTNLIDDIQNQDPITAANWLKKAAATQRAVAEGKGPTSDKAAQKARIYTEVANNIDDLTYSAVPQKNVNRMFEDTIDEFSARAKEARAAGNKKYATAYEKLAKELDGTERTIAAYRTFKKDFVKSSQLAEISRGAQSGSLEAGYKRGNVLGRVVNTLAEEPINRTLAYAGGKLSDIGDIVNGTSNTKLGQMAGRAGNAASNAWGALNNETLSNKSFGGSDLNLPTFGDIATRQTARQAAIDQMAEQARQRELQKAQTDMRDALQDYSNASNQMIQAKNDVETARAQVGTANGGNTMDTIAQAMNRALAVGDINSYSKLADLYKQAYSIYQLQNPESAKTTSDAKALNATQAKALTGLSQLQQLATMQPGARTALSNSPLSGFIDLTGGDSYNSQADSLASTIGYLLTGATIKDSEKEAVKRDYIPSAFDSPTVRQQKLSRAEQLLRNYLADTNALTTL